MVVSLTPAVGWTGSTDSLCCNYTFPHCLLSLPNRRLWLILAVCGCGKIHSWCFTHSACDVVAILASLKHSMMLTLVYMYILVSMWGLAYTSWNLWRTFEENSFINLSTCITCGCSAGNIFMWKLFSLKFEVFTAPEQEMRLSFHVLSVFFSLSLSPHSYTGSSYKVGGGYVSLTYIQYLHVYAMYIHHSRLLTVSDV